MKYLAKILGLIKSAIQWLATVLFAWMVVLATMQLVFRWFNWGGLGWADLHLRYLVLWLALLGGILAATQDRHIRIDIVEHYLHGRVKITVARIVNIVAGMMTLFLTGYAIRFLLSEYESGTIVDNLIFGLSLPLWVLELVIPVGMALLSFFFIGNALLGPSFHSEHKA